MKFDIRARFERTVQKIQAYLNLTRTAGTLMKTCIYLRQFAKFFVEIQMFQAKVAEKIKIF
jgi:hypothetical protein